MAINGNPFQSYDHLFDGRPYSIAFVVLSCIFIGPLLVLWVHSLRSMKRDEDQARSAVPWIKAIFPVWIFCLVLTTVYGGMNLQLVLEDPYHHYQRIDTSVYAQAMMRIAPVARWLGILSGTILSVAFVELGIGFFHCLRDVNSLGAYTYNTSSRTKVYLRYSGWAWGVVLFLMSVAWFGFEQYILTQTIEVYDRYGSGGGTVGSTTTTPNNLPPGLIKKAQELGKHQKTMARLELLLDLFLVIVALKAFVVAVVVLSRTSRPRVLLNSAILFLIATIFNLARQAYTTAMHIVYELPTNQTDPLPGLVYPLVVTPMMDHVNMSVVLVLLYVIAIKNGKGLWSRHHLSLDMSMLPQSPQLPFQRTPTRVRRKKLYIAAASKYDHDEESAIGPAEGATAIAVGPMSYPGVGGRYEMVTN